MAKPSGHPQRDEGSVELGGYQQELTRTLGSFRVFTISVAVVIFPAYGDGLKDAGRVGIWLWVLMPVGPGPLALVYAPC